MKTFFTKLNDFFSGNNEVPEIKHTEDSAEGDEGIDNFTFEETEGIPTTDYSIDNDQQDNDSDTISED